MKVGIVLHPYGERYPAGLARTIFEFTKALLKNDPENEYIIFVKKEPTEFPALPGTNWKLKCLGGGRLWLDRISNYDVDVCVFNTPVLPLRFRPKKSLILALDFGYMYFAAANLQVWARNKITRWCHGFSLRRADAIVAISEATKQDVVRLFGIPPSRTQVVYCGYKKIGEIPEEPIAALPERFFFFVGIIKERKNVLAAVKAFHIFSGSGGDYNLLLGGNGQGDYYTAVREYVRKNNLEMRVRFLGHLNDGQLSYLYKRAFALVFPSIVEGFGYPVLEAMDCGLPIITSNVSSLAELGGNGAALLVDPYKPEEIAGAMSNLASNKALREQLIQNGFRQARNFSWDKAARELLDIVEKLHGERD